ncbi:hypothetical protein JTB14_002973 [Gonioctena quinquepunctata]|nr:hypothetical protein JTB14_002973 [Gonioctena quinquepunctata]
MGDYLAWPVSPTRKGKRETERFPFAITAKRLQKMHRRKREILKEEEMKKQERKKNVKTSEKIRREKKKATYNKQKCKVCDSMLKTSYKLQCDECQGLFYKKCIPRSHKDNIPGDKDGDNFLCHICYKEDSQASRRKKMKMNPMNTIPSKFRKISKVLPKKFME